MPFTLDDPAHALRAVRAGLPLSLAEGDDPWVSVAELAVRLPAPASGPGIDRPPGVVPTADGEVAIAVRFVTRSEAPTAVANFAVQAFPDDDSKRLAHYAVLELLRNGLTHSRAAGAYVVTSRAHVGAKGTGPLGALVQVCVADAGIGLLESLRGMHPSLVDAKEALEKALWPHYSGAFEEGLTGSGENAGLGLFFISEMTKLIGGRLLIASRGAARLLRGDPEHQGNNRQEFIDAEFPGTLVVFEIPTDHVLDYDGIMERIRALAEERTPRRHSIKWLKFEAAPADVRVFSIAPTEHAAETHAFARATLRPLAIEHEAFALDFADVDVATQSWVHALLFDVLRLAWATRTPIYIRNAKPAVRSSLLLVENYALAG